mgnify:CR=1 FL=1
MKKVAIGGGQGFWGDSPDAAIHMIRMPISSIWAVIIWQS